MRLDFERDGYGVFERVVPASTCAAVLHEIESFLGVDLDDASTWSACPTENQGIVPLHHTQAQWDVRQHPGVHEAFASLWGTPRLWVSFDRAIFRVPSQSVPPADPTLHWDRDPRLPGRMIQGMLYLEDTPAERGGIAVAPTIFRSLREVLATDRADTNAWTIAARAGEWFPVAGPAGTLVVWDARMPHGGAPNTSTRPRVSQAVAMFPPELFGADYDARVAAFLAKEVPEVWRGLVGQVHPEPGAPATLTALGRKLVGFDSW